MRDERDSNPDGGPRSGGKPHGPGGLLCAMGLRLGMGLVLTSALVLGSCGTTQRLPGPLNPLPEGLPPAPPPRPGATEVTVIRRSEGVRIQRPGAPAGYALDNSNTRARAVAGSIVLTAGSGRSEILWDDSPASVVLLGPGAVRVGDRSAGEPLVSLLFLTRMRITLGAGDSLELPGGAILQGNSRRLTGPFLVFDAGLGSVRLQNQALRPLGLQLGDLDFEIAGGAIVELPATAAAVSAGAAGEVEGELPLDRVQAGPLELHVRGDVEWTQDGERVRLSASGPAEVHGLGLILHLEAGQTATLGPLGGKAH